ncbi:hypothetical protein ABZ721_14270 [Streptomyces sp. NPDC006733]|uniref:hypothetical protein n=1 Tax=Streptomyces sp. NPDC006733 TaxID=3155460 RepID=UPI0033CA4A7F
MSPDEAEHTQFPDPLPRRRRELPSPPLLAEGEPHKTHEPIVLGPLPDLPVQRQKGVRIGLWGSPAAGKTTFLGALRLAALSSPIAYGHWQVIASDDVSESFLIETSRRLSIERRFPEATQSSRKFSWRFLGDLTDSPYARRRRFRGRGASNEVQFLLSLLDVSGDTYEDLNDNLAAKESIEHLADSSGLIYLFDPTREAADGRSFGYLNGTLARLSRKCLAEGRLDGPYLPHHISVCLTKFDDPEVFERARRGGWTDTGPNGTPVVPEAEQFFDWLAKDMHGGTMALVAEALRASFHPSRIRFFVTSSIGFGTSPAGAVDLHRFGNVDEVDGAQQIIGPVIPHNVMEPVISLLLGIRNRG